MFERYTEKARRVIFFARYEASHYGSPCIETEHLLLGLFREDRQLARLMRTGSVELIRTQIDSRRSHPPVSTSVDLPLSTDSKRVLSYAADEAERLLHRHIGTEHLLLALLRMENCSVSAMLRESGLALDPLREKFSKASIWPSFAAPPDSSARLRYLAGSPTVSIRGASWNADYIHERVKSCREFNWHWHKQEYKPRDVAVHRTDARISFDLTLAQDSAQFDLAKGGWKKDHCFVCRWELSESSDPQHSIGYTNGRVWVCLECYEKFLQGPDFFATSHPEIT